MLKVSAIAETRQHAKSAPASDGSPADEFDKAIARIGVGSNEHGATGVFAVVEGEKKTAASVPFGFVIGAKNKGAAFELCEANQDSQPIAEMAKRLEDAVAERADVGGEADTEDIEGVYFAGCVGEANKVHWPGAVGEKSRERSVRAAACEIPQKRVAGAQWKKTKSGAFRQGMARENTVENFVSRAITANREKFSVALLISFARQLHCVAGPGRGNNIDVQTLFAKTGQSWPGELGGSASARGGIDNCEKTVAWRGHGD